MNCMVRIKINNCTMYNQLQSQLSFNSKRKTIFFSIFQQHILEFLLRVVSLLVLWINRFLIEWKANLISKQGPHRREFPQKYKVYMYIHKTFIDASHMTEYQQLQVLSLGCFSLKCIAFSTFVFSHCFSDVYVVRKTCNLDTVLF